MGFHFLLQGIFLTQGWNPCLLHWQADSLPLHHLGTPWMFLTSICMYASTGPPYKNKQTTDKLVDAITTSTILIPHFIMRENKMYDNIVEDK